MNISEDNLNFLFSYVRSIFGIDKRYTDAPEFIGSGFLLKHENLYLVSAGHVIDYFGKDGFPLFLDGDGGRLVKISGDSIFSYTEDPIKRKDDRIDISIVRLSDETQKRLESVNFLELKNLDLNQEHEPNFGYCTVGVPVKRGNEGINKDDKLILPEPYGFCAIESGLETYHNLGVTRSKHLALSFNRKKVYSEKGLKRTAPSLAGLSGSPIWGFKTKGKSEIEAVVVAMLIEYHEKNIKAILSIKITEIFDLFKARNGGSGLSKSH